MNEISWVWFTVTVIIVMMFGSVAIMEVYKPYSICAEAEKLTPFCEKLLEK